MAAIAVAGGVKRGSSTPQGLNKQMTAQLKLEREFDNIQQLSLQETVDGIVSKLGGGALNRAALSEALGDVGRSTVEGADNATEEELDFLMYFVARGRHPKAATAEELKPGQLQEVEVKELPMLVDIWRAYLDRFEVARTLLCQFSNGANKVTRKELPALLAEVNGPENPPVPAEVGHWILQSADVLGRQELGGLEIARVLICWHQWSDVMDPKGDGRRLAGYIRKDRGLPKRRRGGSSKACALL